MRRLLALIFLSLYFYNIVGYLALFSVLQCRIRSEVKMDLKGSLSESDLTVLSFHPISLHALQWIEDHEFRYNGHMYDVVRSYTRGDSTYYVCINDVQEEQLFAHLDNHVQRHMGDSGLAGTLDSFKDLFLDSFFECRTPSPAASMVQSLGINPDFEKYLSFEVDVPFPPPRSCQQTTASSSSHSV